MTITACITVKNRGYALAKTVRSLLDAGIDEIAISDWYSIDLERVWLANIDRLKFTSLMGDFSIGRGKNEAAKLATSDMIFFLDADVLVTKQALNMGRKVVELGLVYMPIMWMEKQGWGIHSFGQVALLRSKWLESKPWPEWTSYGGEDNVFAYQFEPGIVRDLQPGLVHQFHDHDLRERYYAKPAGTDLKNWEKENQWGKYGRR